MRRPRLPRTVFALAAVSLFTDASSEMIYPLLPIFLTTVLGASATTLGAIEGAAESVAALLKLASGGWSDRLRDASRWSWSDMRSRRSCVRSSGSRRERCTSLPYE